jgi:uncharacterized protein (DUF697 family)
MINLRHKIVNLPSGDCFPSNNNYMDDLTININKAFRSHRLSLAKNLGRRYVLIAARLSVLPLPFIDYAAVSAVQSKIVHFLAQLYQRPVKPGLIKSLVNALLSDGSISGCGLLVIGLGSSFPELRTLVGGGYAASLAGVTLATSEILIRHFEVGGTIDKIDSTIDKLN